MNRAQALIDQRSRSAQEAVLDAIRRQPGVTTRALAELLQMPLEVLKNRVYRLRIAGQVVDRSEAGFEGLWFAVSPIPRCRSVFELGASL